jgi:uncharacterized membrane protein YfcA
MPELHIVLPFLGLLIIVAAFAGVLAGLLGVGGGIVLVPAFFYMFSGLGYDNAQMMQICLATSLATIIFTSARSVMSHHKKGAVEWGILRGWALGIVIGAVVGVAVANRLRSDTLVLIFGCLAFVIALYMAFGRAHWQISDTMPTGAKRMALSPMVGFLSVLMGIGGGSFGVPIMTLHGIKIHRAVATAAGFGFIIAVPSVVLFLFSAVPSEGRPPFTIGSVNIAAFAVVVCVTYLTAPLGVKLAHWMDPKPLKRVFAFFLMLVALNMLRRALTG